MLLPTEKGREKAAEAPSSISKFFVLLHTKTDCVLGHSVMMSHAGKHRIKCSNTTQSNLASLLERQADKGGGMTDTHVRKRTHTS